MIQLILKTLPSTLEWMVMFRLEKILQHADENTTREMYFLHPETEISQYDFVVLSSDGRFLYRDSDQSFTHGETLLSHQFEKNGLYEAYEDRLSTFDLDNADSFATGHYPGYGKVVLYIQLGETVAFAQSIFTREPDQWFYEYLQAVGVKYMGGRKMENGLFAVNYENTLSKHISSGILANFSRTDNCNLFFFLHGNINDELAQGLIQAGKKRLQHQQHAVKAALVEVAEKSLQSQLKMKVLLPFGDDPFEFGDVVPKGFVFGALNDRIPEDIFTAQYKESLEGDKLRGLWTFEKDDLETSVDSSLVLFNTYDLEAAKLLAKFKDDKTGAYLPQTDAENPQEGDMQYVPEKDHWCRANIATSALVLSILGQHELEIDEKLVQYVLDNLDNRSDLYFANPYLVDWLYAKALNVADKDGIYKAKLKEEILSSVQSDFSLGNFDKVFSTACGILALKELGCDDNLLFGLQLFILNNYANPLEQKPVPFYSSLIMAEDDEIEGRTCVVNGEKLSVFLYQDIHNMIYYSLVSRSLNILAENVLVDHPGLKQYIEAPVPSRYKANDHLGYIATSSLPNYIEVKAKI